MVPLSGFDEYRAGGWPGRFPEGSEKLNMVSDGADSSPPRESAPAGLWVIALVGIAPFPASAIAYGFGPPDLAQPALKAILTWSAVVLAFLGGVRWGLETMRRGSPRWERQAISVLAPWVAWILFLLRDRISDPMIIGGFIAAFLVQWLYDHQAPDVPARYPRLSTATTAAACISLAVCLDQALRANHMMP